MALTTKGVGVSVTNAESVAPDEMEQRRFTTRRAASLPPALLARVGAMRIAIGAAVIEVPRLIIPQWTNDVGRWVVVEREDE